jgi:hypothetical protein
VRIAARCRDQCSCVVAGWRTRQAQLKPV